jgi:Flp pilus assembly protein protease CpaA
MSMLGNRVGCEAVMLDFIRVPLVVLMLLYGSYRDIKTREISDFIWVIFGSIAVVFDVYELLVGSLGLVTLLVSVGFSLVFGLLTGYLGLFGEADALALVSLALLSPVPPVFFNGGGFQSILMPLSVLSNSVLMAASLAFVVLGMNTVEAGKDLFVGYGSVGWVTKVILLFTGRRARLDKIRGPPYEYPLERINSGVVSLTLRPDISDDEKAVTVLKKLKDNGREYVWVSYSIPFIVALLLGYLVTVFYGDIVLTLLWSYFRVL